MFLIFFQIPAFANSNFAPLLCSVSRTLVLFPISSLYFPSLVLFSFTFSCFAFSATVSLLFNLKEPARVQEPDSASLVQTTISPLLAAHRIWRFLQKYRWHPYRRRATIFSLPPAAQLRVRNGQPSWTTASEGPARLWGKFITKHRRRGESLFSFYFWHGFTRGRLNDCVILQTKVSTVEYKVNTLNMPV